MQFLSAASAWFAAALPVIALMYILKKKYTDTLVPSHMLWNRLLKEQEANRPWQKLRGRWLLLLQLLAALVAVLALMQPVWLRPAVPDGHAVLLIDRSGSMSAEDGAGEGDYRSRLATVVRMASDWLAEQPGDRPVTLVVTGSEPEVLAARESDHDLLRERLSGIVPYYGRSDNAAALSFADSLHGGEKDGMTYVLTDGEWLDAEEAGTLRLSAPAEQWMAGPDPASESAPFENGSVLGMGLREDSGSPGSQYATVTVRNDSLRPRTFGVDLFAYGRNGDELFRTELTLETEARGWQSAESEQLPPADYYKAVLIGNPDAISADNVAYQFPQDTGTGKALLVTDGNLFLEKALLLAGVQIVKASPELSPPKGDLADELDFVVLDGHYDALKDVEEWGDWLKGMPLWVIDHPAEGDPRTLVPADTEVKKADHPVVSYMTLQDTHIGRLFEPEAGEVSWGKDILQYGGHPAIYAGTSQGRPNLRFTFSLQDTDLPLRPEFPILIMQASEWMNGGAMPQLGTGVSGGQLAITLQSDTERAQWVMVEGMGLTEKERELAAASMAYERSEEQVKLPSLPGLYRLEEHNGAGEVTASRLLAVSPDMAELESIRTEDAVLKLASDEAAEGSQPNGGLAGLTMEPHSLAAIALMLLLVVMIAEWEVYRRGHIG
jgi:hypothetical protein